MAFQTTTPASPAWGQLSTKERLVQAGIQLFSKHGYEATTSRMIADLSGTNVASMAFHFGNKENFYSAVMEHVADIVRQDYSPFWEEVVQAHQDRTPSPDEAWGLIEKYVDLLLSIIAKATPNGLSDNMAILNLLFREQLMPPHGRYPLTTVLCKQSEAMLNLLLTDLWQFKDDRTAAIISRTVTGAIISFGEHPMFIRRALNEADDAVLGEDVWGTLRSFILSSIKSYHPRRTEGPAVKLQQSMENARKSTDKGVEQLQKM